jgi:hypothetical protein
MCFQLTDIQAGQEFFTFNILGLFIKFFLWYVLPTYKILTTS